VKPRAIRTILVDDERPARTRLRRMLASEGEDIEIVAECSDGVSAVDAIRAHSPDLVLLDIQMPSLDGFGVLEALGDDEQPQAVIFCTAYDEYAIRAFDACALDYLLKPATPERLAKAIDRVREQLARTKSVAVPQDAGPEAGKNRFVSRSGGRVAFISPGEIDWIEAAGNYAILHVGDRGHMLRETMTGLEAKLDPAIFVRVSRSTILNLLKVQELRAPTAGRPFAVFAGGQKVHFTVSLKELQGRIEGVG